MKIRHDVPLLTLPALCAVAGRLHVPPLPEAAGSTAEVATNVVLSAADRLADPIHFSVTLNAADCNNADVVFGIDSDGDGVMSAREERVAVSWDCGSWRLIDCRTRSEVCAAAAPGRRTYWTLRRGSGCVRAELHGEAAALSVPVDDGFEDWNLVKVVARGEPSPAVSVSCPASARGFSVFVR